MRYTNKIIGLIVNKVVTRIIREFRERWSTL